MCVQMFPIGFRNFFFWASLSSGLHLKTPTFQKPAIKMPAMGTNNLWIIMNDSLNEWFSSMNQKEKASKQQYVLLIKWWRVSSQVRGMALTETRSSCSGHGICLLRLGSAAPPVSASAIGSGRAWLARACHPSVFIHPSLPKAKVIDAPTSTLTGFIKLLFRAHRSQEGCSFLCNLYKWLWICGF